MIQLYSLKPSDEFVKYVQELLEPLGQIRASRFFGGVGLAYNSVQFAMMIGENLYFVVDDSTRPKYEKLAAQPFAYDTKKGHIIVRRYYEVPDDVLAEPETLQIWAKEAIEIAYKTRKSSKSPKKPKLVR